LRDSELPKSSQVKQGEEATETDRQQTDTYFEEERREEERGSDSGRGREKSKR
jgi:hypothetical protein